jgi:hypothetical protein
MYKASHRCYCAFCRTERVVYRKKHLTPIDAALTAVGSLLIMLLVFQDFDPRILVFFAIGLVLTELFVILRWRMTITCAKCGFDPVLYKKDPEKAAQKVKAYMTERSDDPLWVLSQPKLRPVIKKKGASGSRLNLKG